MAEAVEEYPTLEKEDFLSAAWHDRDVYLTGIPARWHGYSVDLPDRGITRLYPLRVGNFGEILPHIYAARMRRAEDSLKSSPLHDVNLQVRMLSGDYGQDTDEPTNLFHALRHTLEEKPYSKKTELAVKLQELLESYQDMREAQRVKVVRGLTHTIGKCELYIVASDLAVRQNPNTTTESSLYAARLSGIVNIRDGDNMNYRILVNDPYSNQGFLPSTFRVTTGVSAPAR